MKLKPSTPVTFTNPIDDVKHPGVVETVETEHRTDSSGEQVTVDVFSVQLEGGGIVRAERAWLTARKES